MSYITTYLLPHLTGLFFTGFPGVVLLLFLLSFFIPKPALWNNLFRLSNTMLLVGAILLGIHFAGELFMAWYSQVPGEQDAFTWRIFGPYWWGYWIVSFLPLLAPQVFWLRKVRKSRTASLVMIPLISAGAIMEFIIIRVIPYRDHRPAGWTYHSPGLMAYVTPVCLFGAVLMALYFAEGLLRKSRQQDRGK